MKKIDTKAIMAETNREMKKSIENQIRDRIKHDFPEITEFTVDWDIKNSKINITGLTQEQIDQIL